MPDHAALDADQLHVLQHSLGLDQYGRGEMYRNYYWGQSDVCDSLVAIGYMTSGIQSGDTLYSVTDLGKEAVLQQSPKPPKMTRGQERYQRWCDTASDYMSFGEWLKHKEYHVA